MDHANDDAPPHAVVEWVEPEDREPNGGGLDQRLAYNFKIHSTLRTSPAMATGVTGRLFDMLDLVNLLIESESEKAGC